LSKPKLTKSCRAEEEEEAAGIPLKMLLLHICNDITDVVSVGITRKSNFKS
jgi:hypothetical protein